MLRCRKVRKKKAPVSFFKKEKERKQQKGRESGCEQQNQERRLHVGKTIAIKDAIRLQLLGKREKVAARGGKGPVPNLIPQKEHPHQSIKKGFLLIS